MRLRGLAMIGGREWHGRGWSHLEYCVKTGNQALDKIYGMPIFEFFSKNPEQAQILDEAMTGLSTIDGPAVADAYDFDGIHTPAAIPSTICFSARRCFRFR